MSEIFYEIPHHEKYGISKLGNIVNFSTSEKEIPYKKHSEYCITLDGEEMKLAKISLNVFIGKFAGNIIYKYSQELYDINSVKYELKIYVENDSIIFINGVSFRKIPKFERYFISRDGVIFSSITNKLLIRHFSDKGYPVIGLSDGHERFLKKIHRLVYATYIGDLNPMMIVDHVNGHKWCCSDWNLEQISQRENVSRAYKTGCNPLNHWTDDQIRTITIELTKNSPIRVILQKLGLPESEYRNLTTIIHLLRYKGYFKEITKDYNLSNYISELNKKDRVLNPEDVVDIKRHLYFNDMTIKNLSRKYKCSTSTISKIRDGKTWKHISCEFNE